VEFVKKVGREVSDGNTNKKSSVTNGFTFIVTAVEKKKVIQT